MQGKPTLRQRQRENRHQAILDAAEELFAEQGFAAVRFEDVAVAACVSKPTLYAHFRSKEDVAVGLALKHLKQVSDCLTMQDRAKSAWERLDEFIGWAVEFRFGGDSRFVHALAQYVLPFRHSASPLVAAEAEVLGRLAELVGEAQREGGVRADIGPECLAALMLSSQHGYLDNLLATGSIGTGDIVRMWTALLTPASG